MLFYYVHKKRLIDFRKVANAGASKKRRGGRQSKQKSNALLADIQQRDEEKPRRGGRRKGGAAATNHVASSSQSSPKANGTQVAETATTTIDDAVATETATPQNGESSKTSRKRSHEANETLTFAFKLDPAEPTPQAKAKRRKGIHWAKVVSVDQQEIEDNASAVSENCLFETVRSDLNVFANQDTDSIIEPPKKPKRARKSKNGSRASSPVPETKFVDGNEPVTKRKGPSTMAVWTERDKGWFSRVIVFGVLYTNAHMFGLHLADFIRLLSKYGKDFKRIAVGIPSKVRCNAHVEI